MTPTQFGGPLGAPASRRHLLVRASHACRRGRRRTQEGLRDMQASAMRIRVSAFAGAMRRKRPRRAAP